MFSIKYVNSLKNWKWEGISCIKLQKNEKITYEIENNNHKCFIYKKLNSYDEKKKLQNTDLYSYDIYLCQNNHSAVRKFIKHSQAYWLNLTSSAHIGKY